MTLRLPQKEGLFKHNISYQIDGGGILSVPVFCGESENFIAKFLFLLFHFSCFTSLKINKIQTADYQLIISILYINTLTFRLFHFVSRPFC